MPALSITIYIQSCLLVVCAIASLSNDDDAFLFSFPPPHTHLSHTNTLWFYSGESSKIKITGAALGKELSLKFQTTIRILKSDAKGSKDTLENEKLSLRFYGFSKQ